MGETWNIQRLAIVDSEPVVSTVTTVHELEYHSEWMGESSVVVTVKSPTHIDFHFDDYIVYRGEVFYLPNDAPVLKQARSQTYGEGFVYENMKFLSLASKLQDVLFKDVVLHDNNLSYTSQGKFSFYAGSVEDLADRIAANLLRVTGSTLLSVYGGFTILTSDVTRTRQRYDGTLPSEWSTYYNESHSAGKTDVNIDVDNLSVWSALQLAYSKFELSFYIAGTTVVIGGDPIVPSKIFQYGLGHGLRKISRTTNNDELVTKVYGYGSDKNMPLNYYANLGKKIVFGGRRTRQYDDTIGAYVYGVETDVPFDTVSGAIIRDDANCVIRNGNTTATATAVSVPDDNSDTPRLYLSLHHGSGADVAFYNAIGVDTWVPINVDAGMNINALPSTLVEEDESYSYPSALSITNLMLPGFPTMSLKAWLESVRDGGRTVGGFSRGDAMHLLATFVFSEDPFDPWVMSDNAETLGIIEGVVNFDSEENEIYPSIENTGANIFKSDSAVEDNGYLGEDPKEADTRFSIVAADGIDWKELFKNRDGELVIEMTSGYCVGRKFNVHSTPKQDDGGNWSLLLERDQDEFGRYYPYFEYESFCQVRADDTFVVTGTPLPDSYIESASAQLLKAVCEWLVKYDHPNHVYAPTIDNIYMAKQHDRWVAGNETVSLHDMLRGGMQMKLMDSDLGISLDDVHEPSLYIDNITIKEKADNGIPSYDIVLRDGDKEEGTLESLKRSVAEGSGGNGTDGRGWKRQSRNDFLSRVSDDYAQGVIKFLQGLLLGNDGYGITADGMATLRGLLSKHFQSGELGGTGFGIYSDENGVSTAEVDKLIVRMKAVFAELEIKKKTFTAGDVGFSDAANKILLVIPLDTNGNETTGIPVAYRCCWLMKDGETAVSNDWDVSDQARCQTFNIKSGVYTNVANRYYWRKVLEVGDGFEYDGSTYNYIDLAATVTGTYKGTAFTKGCQSSVTNDVPAAGDDIVQLGNQDDNKKHRQNFTEIVINGSDAPAIKQYQGVNDYTLDGKMIRGDYYDPVKDTYRSVVYGDWYAGDKTKEGGYAEYDTATNTFTVKGKLQVGSTLDDGRDVNDLGLQQGNLLRNSGFTGDYESETVNSSDVLSGDTIVYSDPFDYWTVSGCEAIDEPLSSSGKAAVIGTLEQTIVGGMTVGEWYIFSFRGRNGSVTMSAGGVTYTFDLTGDIERYDYPFVCTSNAPFRLQGSGSEVMELQLMVGSLPSEWHSSAKDNDKAVAEYYANEYLRKAITEASTSIIGGLILTQILKVGNFRYSSERGGYVMSEETGGMSGAYNDERSPFLWGGGNMEQAIYAIMKYASDPSYQATDAEVARMAKFVVTHGGRAILNDIILRGYIYAVGGEFSGTIKAATGVFSGFVEKKKLIITEQNAAQYIKSYGHFGDRYLDVKKSGTWIEFRQLNQGFTVFLPCLYSTVTSYSQQEIEEVRSIIGNTIILHNMANVDISVTGNNKASDDAGAGVSFYIQPGKIATLTCKLGDVNGCEDIYWLYKVADSHEAMSSNSS